MLQSPNPRIPIGRSWDQLNQVIPNSKNETLKTYYKNLSGAVDEAVVEASRVDCGVTTIQDLDCIALAIKLITNRGVDPDAMLLGTQDQDDILHFKRVMWNMVATKSRTDGVDTTKLPKNTQPNTTVFKNCCTNIEEELDQKTSAYVISPLGYAIRASKSPVDYGDVDQKQDPDRAL